MKKIQIFFCVVITVGIVLFLTVSPSYIAANSSRDPYREWMLPDEEEFSGIIHVWHIVDFKAHTGSVSAWLESRANALERKHFEVFLEISAMTVDEYRLRLEHGDSADIYSFPLGLTYQDDFLPLDKYSEVWSESGINESLLKTGMYDGTKYALPFMYSGYALIVNSAASAEHGFDYEECFEEQDGLKSAVEHMTYENRGQSVSGISGNALVYAMQGVQGECLSYQDFTAGKASMAIGDFRAVSDSIRNYENGRGSMTDAYPITDYTDLVQYIALDKDIPEKKIPYALEFISLILNKDAQSSLCDLNAYPTIDGLEDLDLDGIAEEAYAVLCEPRVPNCFLYKRYKDALTEDAVLSLSGDSSAYERMTGRLYELTE